MHAPLALCAALALAAPQAKKSPQKSAAPPTDDAGFVAALDGVRKLEDAGKWSEAGVALEYLLAGTGDTPFVRGRRTEIVAEAQRIAVRSAVPLPDPGTLIQGKLIHWEKKTGDLSLVYEPGKYDDFEKAGKALLHPADFDGPVSIKVEGDRFAYFGKELLVFIVGAHDDEYYDVSIGCEKRLGTGVYPPLFAVRRVRGGKAEMLVETEKGPVADKRFEIEVSVGSDEIAVTLNGARLGQAKRPKELHGRVGFSTGGRAFKRLSLRGRASTAWLQGKLDAATHDAEAKFLATWNPDDALPKWLRSSAAPAPAPIRSRLDPESLPWPMAPPQVEYAHEIGKLIDAGKARDALKSLRKRKATELPRDLLEYLFLVTLDALDSLALNQKLVDGFKESHPDFAFAARMQAHAAIESGRFEEAARGLAALRGKVPDEAVLAHDLVRLDLLLERVDEAAGVLREERIAGVMSPELEALEQQILHLQRGPAFARRYEEKSDHFVLVTDMDSKTPKTALLQLEESYRICTRIFGESQAPPRLFPVYLFAGRTGYEAYAVNVGELAHSTAGMYSPIFKQLLVWNLPEREETARTLRHEATHQYLDLLDYRLPVWLNEGFASYVQMIASSRKSDVTAGEVDRDLLRSWSANRAHVIELSDFLEIRPKNFYAIAPVTYPESWALVHYLRHAKPAKDAPAPAPAEILARMVKALRDRAPIPEVSKRGFEGVDLATFQGAFFDYVDDLCRAEGVR